MRDIFLLMKNKHVYFVTEKKVRWQTGVDRFGRALKKKVTRLVTRRRFIRMSNRRAVFYKKRHYWKNSLRPYMNKKPYWRWKSYRIVSLVKRSIRALSFLSFRGSRSLKQFSFVSSNKLRFSVAKKRARVLRKISFLTSSTQQRRSVARSTASDSNSSFTFSRVRLKEALSKKKKDKLLLNSLGLNYKRFLSFMRTGKRRYFYKYKIYSNLYVARLFEFSSNKNLSRFKKKLKHKRVRLGYFVHYFLNRLDFCLLRWHVDWEKWTLRKAQLMVYHGLVLVNFERKRSYLYKLRSSDFVLICAGGQNAFNGYWKLNRPSFLKYGKTKYRSGFPRFEAKSRMIKKLRRSLRMRAEGRVSGGFMPDDPSLRTLFNQYIFTTWNRCFFKYYHHFYEVSRKLKGFVYIVPARQLTLAKNTLTQSVTKIFLYRWLNYFVNMSFY